MSETPQEAAAQASDMEAEAPADESKAFDVTGSVDATDQHDAYKQLQAHFLALSRGDAGTLDGVQVQVA